MLALTQTVSETLDAVSITLGYLLLGGRPPTAASAYRDGVGEKNGTAERRLDSAQGARFRILVHD